MVRNMIADKVLNLKYTDWNGLRKKAADKAKEAEAEIKKTANTNQKQGTKPTHALKRLYRYIFTPRLWNN
jgi:hypothetical protein